MIKATHFNWSLTPINSTPINSLNRLGLASVLAMALFTASTWANCEKQENNLARVLNEVDRNGEFQAKAQSEGNVKYFMSLPAQELEALLPKLYENLENAVRANSRNQSKLWRDRTDVARSELGICNATTAKSSNQSNRNLNTANLISQSQQQSQQSQQSQQQAQQSRAAQQQSQQAVFNSAQNQTAADQTRKSERRRHEPENEAHDCLSLDKSGLFGGIVNKCDFKVAYQFCNFNPKKDSWAESHTCGKSGGADFVGAGRTSAAHVKNTETVYWFACKDPAWPVDVEYVAGKGIQARCYTIGGK